MSAKDHLNDAQMALAVVAADDLPAAHREHLAGCWLCGAENERLEQALAGMGQQARDLTPVPGRRFILPVAQDRPAASRSWGRWAAAATMAAAAVVAAMLWLGPAQQQTQTALVSEDASWSEPSAWDASAPGEEEQPFSSFQNFLLGGDQAGVDEDFMEFVSPWAEEDVSLHGPGRSPC